MIDGAPPDVLERVAASGLLDLRSGEHRRQPRGPLQRAHDLLLRRGHLLHAPWLPAHALGAERARQGPEAFRRKSTSRRSTSRSPAHRRTGSSRSSAISAAAACFAKTTRSCARKAMLLQVCQHHLRPRARGRAQDRSRLSRRYRHRVLRALRRLGLHVDGRELQERRTRGRAGPADPSCRQIELSILSRIK